MTDDTQWSKNDETINQIREVVDEDVTDPNDWYRLIIRVRELVGVTR